MASPKIGDVIPEALARLPQPEEEHKQDNLVPGFAYSFEYFPPRTAQGLAKLYERWFSMAKQGAAYADITWGAGGSTSDLTMQLCVDAIKRFGFNVNMHLTCTNLPAEKVHEALKEAKAHGIRNICALRGDPPHGQDAWEPVEGGFACAKDLIEFIRKEYGDYFGISCSGYPEGHPNSFTQVPDDFEFSAGELQRRVRVQGQWSVCLDADFDKELEYLRQKVEAGADAVITQMFYSAELFDEFVRRCRGAGIQVPILPGIMPINGLASFHRMIGFCKTRIPEQLEKLVAQFSAVKNEQGEEEKPADEEGFKQAGMEYVIEMCRSLLAKGHSFLHFYSMNITEPVYKIMSALGQEPNPVQPSEQELSEIAQWAAEASAIVFKA